MNVVIAYFAESFPEDEEFDPCEYLNHRVIFWNFDKNKIIGTNAHRFKENVQHTHYWWQGYTRCLQQMDIPIETTTVYITTPEWRDSKECKKLLQEEV